MAQLNSAWALQSTLGVQHQSLHYHSLLFSTACQSKYNLYLDLHVLSMYYYLYTTV